MNASVNDLKVLAATEGARFDIVAGQVSSEEICSILQSARNKGGMIRVKNAKVLTAEERRMVTLYGAGHMLLEW